MTRSSGFVTLSLALVFAAGCDNAATDDSKARAAQVEAENKQDAAVQEALQKIKSAQVEADEKTSAARADFLRMREDYRHVTTTNLVELDRKVADLVARSGQATGKTKVTLDASLKQIHVSREAFDKDYQSLESTVASSWDAAKVRLDKEWTDLKGLVDKA